MTGPELIEVLEAAGRSDLWEEVVARKWLKTLIGVGVGTLLSAAGMVGALIASKRADGWDDDWSIVAVVLAAAAVVGLVLALSLVPNLFYPEAAALRSLLR